MLLSLSNFVTSYSQCAKLSSKLCMSNVGFSSFARYPMLLVPTGMLYRLLSCLNISYPVSCWYCLQTVAAPPDVTFVRMYFISCDNCFHLFPSSYDEAAVSKSSSVMVVVALSVDLISFSWSECCRPIYAWNLYFHSSYCAMSPLNVGGFNLYLCTPATSACCSVAIACVALSRSRSPPA